MTQPVDYGVVALHLERTRGMVPVTIETTYHSNHLDNAKARSRLGWTPKVDTAMLCDLAFAYERAADDPRNSLPADDLEVFKFKVDVAVKAYA